MEKTQATGMMTSYQMTGVGSATQAVGGGSSKNVKTVRQKKLEAFEDLVAFADLGEDPTETEEEKARKQAIIEAAQTVDDAEVDGLGARPSDLQVGRDADDG
jgi:hypothetical protein